MTWFKVDDGLAFHRKTVAAGNAAMGLWVRAGAWSAHELTDGFIPDHMIGIMGTPAQRAKLVKVGLWIEVDGGCLFHEWNENGRQPTGQSVREKRARAAERQAKHRANLFENLQAEAPRHGVTDASVTDAVTPLLTRAPTRPDPFPSSDEEEMPPAGRRSPRRRAAEPDSETINRAAQSLARGYHDLEPMSSFVAVMKLAKKALENDYDRAEIASALARLAEAKRSVTANSLRIELDGPPLQTARSPHELFGNAGAWQALKHTGTDDNVRAITGGDQHVVS